MKKFMMFSLAFFSVQAFAAKDVDTSQVTSVYQLDSDSTAFEFFSNIPNSCGSSNYRVKSSNETLANRKFSIVLTAFTNNNNLAFHDTQVCESGRSVVAWVRISKDAQ